MDIRKFFSPVNKAPQIKDKNISKDRKRKLIRIDSDDEDPIPSKNKKSQAVASDSDDDIFITTPKADKPKLTEPKEKNNLPLIINKSKKGSKSVLESNPKRVESKSKLKPTSAIDFFGISPVAQSQVPTKKKVEKPIEIHNDDDFTKTLLQLDQRKSYHKSKKPTEEKHKLPEDKKCKPKMGSEVEHKEMLKSPKKEKLNSLDEKKSELKEGKLKSNVISSPSKSNIKTGLASKLAAKSKASKEEREKQSLELKSEPLSDRSKLANSQKSPLKISKVHNSERKETLVKSPVNFSPKIGKKTCSNSKSSKSTDVEFVKHEKENKEKVEELQEIPATPEADEKKKQHVMAFRKYLQRSGPRNPGGKLVPEGKPNCLFGLTFVVTGVLETIDREETSELIKKYGGRVTTSISKNTSYLVVGDEPGESKMKKAEQLKTKLLDEDELFALISSKSAVQEKSTSSRGETPKSSGRDSGKSKLSQFQHNPNLKRKIIADEKLDIHESPTKKITHTHSPISKFPSDSSNSPLSQSSSVSSQPSRTKSGPTQISSQASTGSSQSSTQPLSSQIISSRNTPSVMWVDKYKPVSLKNIIGQQGEQSNARKLLRWLSSWTSNHTGNKKLTKPSPWSKDNSGAYFKAALLSGPPGVGKTTTAHLTCKELGYDSVEMNASDTRSKRALTEEVAELLSNQSLVAFASGVSDSTTSRNHVLIMDEVDGMAGNEDRGGVQELIGLIKSSRVPIICMCNDRNHPKIRSLANHCFDLRFYKPKIEQIRGAMMSVCFKEGIKMKPEALDQVIIGSNQDVRQVLHHLSLWSADQKVLETDQMKKDSKMSKKEFKMGPWDVVSKVFSESSHKDMSIHDRVSLFFHDYSIGPLFVQENYLKVIPHSAKGNLVKTLKAVAKTAAVLTDADLIDKSIRKDSAWSLLPSQALFASVFPGEYMAGHFSSQVEFPRWLGNNSRKNKFDRLSQDLHTHLRLRVSGSKQDIISDYSSRIRDAVIQPIVKMGSDGVKESVHVMTSHDLVRDDLESLIELTTWPGFKDKMAGVDSKVKAAFTRALNKDPHLSPFSTGSAIFKKKLKSANDEFDMDGEEEDDDDEDEDDDDIAKDSMIKPGKRTAAKKESKASTSSSSTSKGKGGKSKSKK